MAINELGHKLLTQRGRDAVASIPEADARRIVERTLEICAEGLVAVDALELTPHEDSDEESASLAAWNALAPDVRNIMMASHKASSELATLFPADGGYGMTPDIDIDAAFDMMASFDLPKPIKDRREEEIEQLLGQLDGQFGLSSIGPTIHSMVNMLRADMTSFGERLRNPKVVADRWFLLGELQELRAKCSQAFESIAVTVLSGFSDESPAKLMPRYASAAGRAALLRSAVVDLHYDVERMQEEANANDLPAVSAVRHALVLRLNQFTELPAYRFIRPLDKREVDQFRLRMNGLDLNEKTVGTLRHEIEGFSKFLEVMRSINEREVLERRDRDALGTARMLLEAEEEIAEVRPFLERAFGRSRSVDEFVRLIRKGSMLDPAELTAAVIAAQQRLPPA